MRCSTTAWCSCSLLLVLEACAFICRCPRAFEERFGIPGWMVLVEKRTEHPFTLYGPLLMWTNRFNTLQGKWKVWKMSTILLSIVQWKLVSIHLDSLLQGFVAKFADMLHMFHFRLKFKTVNATFSCWTSTESFLKTAMFSAFVWACLFTINTNKSVETIKSKVFPRSVSIGSLSFPLFTCLLYLTPCNYKQSILRCGFSYVILLNVRI